MIRKLTVTTAFMTVGVLSSLGYSAIAQTSRPMPSPSQSTPAQNRPAPLPNQSAPMQPQSGQSSMQVSALDRQFVMDAAQGGMAEVQLGQLALQRSTNPEVKQFAQQMIQEHTAANKQLMQIAAQKGIMPPTSVGPKYEAAMMRLKSLSGEAFDQAYMNEAGINGHLESAAVFQRQAALGQDPDLKAFAAKILPTVQGHLEMASEMTGYRFAQQTPSGHMMSTPQ